MPNIKLNVTTSFDNFLRAASGVEITNELAQQDCIDGIDYQSYINTDTLSSPFLPLKNEHLNYLNSLQHGRHIRMARARNIFYLCWQWYSLNEMFFPCIKISDDEFLLYCYDSHWLSMMSVFRQSAPNAFKLSNKFSIHKTKIEHPFVMMGGWGNPSHFFGQYFMRYNLCSLNLEIFHDFKILGFTLPMWQKSLLSDCYSKMMERFEEIDLSDFRPSNGKLLLIQSSMSFFFEDIPQWLGFQHSRAIFRNLVKSRSMKASADLIKLNQNTQNQMIYLTRSFYEKQNKLPLNGQRVIDYIKIAKLLHKHGFLIIFPEKHDILFLQELLLHTQVCVLDPGSCNIHALLAPGQKHLIALSDVTHFNSTSHPSLRSLEWFNAQIGRSLQFCIGKTPHSPNQTFSLTPGPTFYEESLLEILKFNGLH